jgi:hypothetical protein
LNKTNKNYLYFIIFIVVALILFEQTNKPSSSSSSQVYTSQGSNSECDLDGCVREGIGWTNVPPSTSLCKGIPCRPMGAKKGEGYCSKEHANRAIWKNY